MFRSSLYEYRSHEAARLMVAEAMDSNNKKYFYMEGIVLQAEIQNQNQRIYPLNEVRREVSRLTENIQRTGSGIPGELDHPQSLTINLEKVSHLIESIRMEGSNGIGRLKILETNAGLTARKLLEGGLRMGVSTRGSGNVANDGRVGDFELITIDIVAQPSAPDAYPKPIFESLYSPKGYELRELVETTLFDKKDKIAARHYEKELVDFIKKLSN